jgi:hypothetical protein
MDCKKSQRWIALHVEGDLPGRKAARLERHLAECAGCREFASRMEASQAAWKAVGAEPVDEAALREVRARVLARVAAERPRAFPLWRWAAVTAAVALISGTGYVVPNLISTLPPPPPGPGPIVVVQPPVPPPRPQAVARVVPVRKPKPVVKAAEPAQPLLVKLETDDPNVVIYWIVGE